MAGNENDNPNKAHSTENSAMAPPSISAKTMLADITNYQASVAKLETTIARTQALLRSFGIDLTTEQEEWLNDAERQNKIRHAALEETKKQLSDVTQIDASLQSSMTDFTTLMDGISHQEEAFKDLQKKIIASLESEAQHTAKSLDNYLDGHPEVSVIIPKRKTIEEDQLTQLRIAEFKKRKLLQKALTLLEPNATQHDIADEASVAQSILTSKDERLTQLMHALLTLRNKEDVYRKAKSDPVMLGLIRDEIYALSELYLCITHDNSGREQQEIAFHQAHQLCEVAETEKKAFLTHYFDTYSADLKQAKLFTQIILQLHQSANDASKEALAKDARDKCEAARKEWESYLHQIPSLAQITQFEKDYQIRSVNELLRLLNENIKLYDEAKGIIYYSDTSQLITETEADAAEAAIKNVLKSILGSSPDKSTALTLSSPLPINISRPSDTTEFIRVNKTILNATKQNGPTIVHVASVQRISSTTCTSEIHYKSSAIKKLKPIDYIRWAAVEVENFRAASTTPSEPILLTGRKAPPELVRSMQLYCQAKGYPDCQDRTGLSYAPIERKDVEELQTNLANEAYAKQVYGDRDASKALIINEKSALDQFSILRRQQNSAHSSSNTAPTVAPKKT